MKQKNKKKKKEREKKSDFLIAQTAIFIKNKKNKPLP